MSTIVLVLNIAEEYDEAIASVEQSVAEDFRETIFGDTYIVAIDDVSTIDVVAEEWTNAVYNDPSFPEDTDFVLIPALHDEPEEFHRPLLNLYREMGATVIIACTDEEKNSPEFIQVWEQYRLGDLAPWDYIQDHARWSIVRRSTAKHYV